MNEWTITNTFDLANRRREKDVSRINSHVMLSPYYVPKALRSYVDDDSLVIEFKFIEIDEPRYIYSDGKGVSFELGKKTDRIYKISIDLSNIHTQETKRVIVDSLNSAIKTFVTKKSDSKKIMSKYDATISSLKDYANLKDIGINSYFSG